MKKLVAATLVASMVFSQWGGVSAYAGERQDFVDFPKGAGWKTGAIEYSVEYGIMSGNEKGEINPDGVVTRAQLAAMLSRLLGLEDEAALNFKDVPNDAWFAKDMAKVYAAGLMKGKSSEEMAPNAKVTRQEVAAIMARVLCLKEGDVSKLSKFGDEESVSDWAKKGVSALVDKGYLNGNGGNLNPTSSMTRAEFSKLTQNIFPNIVRNAEDAKKIVPGNVIVRNAVALENVEIKGNVILSQKVDPVKVIKASTKLEGGIINTEKSAVVPARELKFDAKGELQNKEVISAPMNADKNKVNEEKKPEEKKPEQKQSSSSSSSSGKKSGGGSSSGGGGIQKPEKDKNLETAEAINKLKTLVIEFGKKDERYYEVEGYDEFNKKMLEAKEFLLKREKTKAEADEITKDLTDSKNKLKEKAEFEVKGESYGIGEEASDLPYLMKVKMKLNSDGKITSIKDDGTQGADSTDESYLQKFKNNGSLGNSEGKGWLRFLNKTLEDVKNMEMSKGNYSAEGDTGIDATAGATACSIAAKCAVINAFGEKKEQPVLIFKNIEKTADGYDVKFSKNLPDNYDVDIQKIRYGIFSGGKLLENEVSVESTVSDITVKIKGELNPGIYTVNIRDKSGKYMELGSNDRIEEIYRQDITFVVTNENASANFDEATETIVAAGCEIENLINNFKEVEIYTAKYDGDKGYYPYRRIYDVKISEDGVLNQKYLDNKYKNNLIFDATGNINKDFRNDDGELVFEKNKKYILHIHVYGIKKEIEFPYSVEITTAKFFNKYINKHVSIENDKLKVSFFAELPKGYQPKLKALYRGIDKEDRQEIQLTEDNVSLEFDSNSVLITIDGASSFTPGIYFADIVDGSTEPKETEKGISISEYGEPEGAVFEVFGNQDKVQNRLDSSGKFVTIGSNVQIKDITDNIYVMYLDKKRIKLLDDNGNKKEAYKGLFNDEGVLNKDFKEPGSQDLLFENVRNVYIYIFGFSYYTYSNGYQYRNIVTHTFP